MTEKHPNLRAPWKKGECGNPKGRPKGTSVTSRIKRILDENEGQVSEALAKAMVKAALKGDHKFVKEILDRVEGKVTDNVELGGTDGSPIVINLTRGVDPRKADDADD